MVAIVAGNGLGLFNTSLNILGSAGVLGQGWLGQASGRAHVNAATGNLILQFQDEQLSGRGTDLFHLRTYNSLGKVSGQFTDGDVDGWRWDGERKLVLTGTVNTNGSSVKRTGGDGSETTYNWDGTRYVSTDGSGAHDTLEYDGSAATDMRWKWTDGTTRLVERYGTTADQSTWQLRHQVDTSGNVIDYDYSNGRLSSITDHASGQRIELVYTSTNPVRLSQVNTHSLLADGTVGSAVKQVEYTYDAGRLNTVKTVLKPTAGTSTYYTTSYAYEGSTTRISSITQSDGTRVDFTYDGSDRISTLIDGNGKQAFAYRTNGDGTQSTDITISAVDGSNPQTWTYTYDATSKQLKKVESPAPTAGAARLVTTFTYETNEADGAGHAGNLKTITQMIDATHSRTITYGYDNRGNRILERDSLGNTVTRTFDSKNQVLTETRYKSVDPDGSGSQLPDPQSAMTTRFAYDSQSRLRFVISAEGRVSESRYGTNGLLERTVQYTANRFSGSGFSETDLANWVSSNPVDKSLTQLTQYAYDLRGNLSQRTDYATVNTSGNGVLNAAATVTEYIYDAHGQLLKTIAVRGSGRDQRTELTSFLYDGMGRETQRVTSSGTQTTLYNGVDYAGAANTIQVTNGTPADPNKLTVLNTFDNAGRLTSSSRSGNATTRDTKYFYDAQGRLTMTQDAQGGRHFSFYDVAGRLSFQVDSSGSVTGFAYNGAGQLLTETRYSNSASNIGTWLDNATNPTKVIKATFVVAAAAGGGVDLVSDSTKDRATAYGYDDAGRLTTRIDAANTISMTTYDGASRVTQQQTNDRVTRYFYDADGRQVGVVDPLGYLTESKYDAAGRLVETVRYTTRSPSATNVSAPVWIGVSNQTAVGGKPFTYRVYAVDGDGDSLTFSKVGTWPTWLSLDTSVPNAPVLTGTPPKTLTSYDVIVRADDDDGRGKTSDVTVHITVANTAPNWTTLPDVVVATNTANFSYTLPVAADNEGGALTYSIVGGNAALPTGLTFTSPTISGTPTVPGTYVITARVTDAGTPPLATERTFILHVGNRAPTWDVTPTPPNAVRAQAFSYTVPAAQDPENQTLSYRIVSAPSWLTISGRTLSGTPPLDPTSLGEHVIKLEAEDTLHETDPLTFIVRVVNLPPTWPASLPLIDKPAGAAVDYTPTAAVDPEGEAITYSYRVLNGQGVLPIGLSFNPANGRISGTTSASQIGDFDVLMTATDARGGAVESLLKIHLRNSPPTYSQGIPNLEGFWNNWIRLAIPANAFTDINGDVVTVSVDGATPGFPPDALNSSGVFFASTGSGGFLNFRDTNPADAGGATRFVTIRATDARGGVTTRTISILVNPLPPPPPPPPPPPAPPPSPPGWPPTLPQAHVPGGGEFALREPTAALTPAPLPVLALEPEPVVAAITPAPAPLQLQALAPVVDVLAAWRPASNVDDLHAYHYYDGQGRLVGAVDERGFLSETIYDSAANKQQNARYETAVTVEANDTLLTLRPDAGEARISTVQFDTMGRVSTTKNEVDGTLTRNEYDELGRLVRQVRADGTSEARANRTRYNAFGEVTGTLGGEGDAWLTADVTRTLDSAINTRGTRYEYDSLGRRVKTLDANGIDDKGNATRLYYDSEGRLTHTLNAKGEVSETKYNPFGQVSSTLRYGTRLDVAGDLFKGLMDGTKSLSDLKPALAGMPPQLNAETKYEYDQRGLATKVSDAEKFDTVSTYNAFGQLATQVRTILKAAGGQDAKTTTTQFDYDLAGQLLSTTGDVGGLNFNTRSVYDAYGRVSKSIDAAGKVTTTEYKDSGRAIEVRDPLDRMVRTEYDAFARVLKVIDGRKQSTNYSYNDAARSVSVTTPEGVTVTTAMTRHGETLSVLDGRSNTTSYAYDKDGHLRTVTDALNRVVTDNKYDTAGRLIETKDARGTVIKFTYDVVNRLFERRVDPAGLNLATTYAWTEFGQQLNVREGTGANTGGAVARETQYSYNLNGQLKKVVVSPGNLKLATSYSYDGLGNTVQVSRGTASSPDQQVTQYVFDKLGRRVKEIAAPSAVLGAGSARTRNLTTEYRYDAAGRVSRTIDANGASTWFVYNDAGELAQTINALGEVVEQSYDANGRVIQQRSYRNRINTAAFGDVVSTVTPSAHASLDRRSYFVYDNDGRERFVLRAVDSGNWIASETRFDANGNVTETRAYDKFIPEAFLTSNDTASSVGISVTEITGKLIDLGYKEQALGFGSTDATTLANLQRTRFAYDAVNRLRFVVDAMGGVSESVYDAAGNVLKTVRYAAVPTLTEFDQTSIDGAVNRVDAANEVTQFAYDAAGRLRFTARQLVAPTGTTAAHSLVMEQRYDTLSNVSQTIAYDNVLTTAVDYNNATAMAGAVQATNRDRISAMAYDVAGRQVYSVQALTVTAARTGMQHLVTKRVYDALGQVVQTISYAAKVPLANYSKATLDSAVAATAVANDPQNRTSHFVYDQAGRLRFAVAADRSFSETIHDALGHVTEVRQFDVLVSPSTPITEDALIGRRSARRVGDGVTRGEKYTYDAVGRRLTTTDAAGHSEISTYDGLGNRATFIDKNGVAVLNQHLNDDPPFDQALVTWSYTYDRLGRRIDEITPKLDFQLSSETAPPAGGRRLVNRNSYDVFGNLAQTIEALQTVDARITQFGYDKLHRRTLVVLPGYYAPPTDDPTTGKVEKTSAAGRFQRTLETAYDALGNAVRTKLRTAVSSYQYEYKTYDALGRVVHDIDAMGGVSSFNYNAFGEQTSVTRFSKSIGTSAPGGANAMWAANAVATALGTDTLARTVTVDYDNLGRKTKVTQAAVASYFFSSTSLTTNAASVTPVSAAAVTRYDYNAFGDIVHEAANVDNVGTGNFNGPGHWRDTWRYFDAMGRETLSVDALGYQTARSYDALGNIEETTEYANAGGSGVIDSAIPPATPSRSSADRTTVFVYNALNQRTSIHRLGVTYSSLVGGNYVQTRGNAVIASMTYDAMGNVRTQTDALNNVTTTDYNALGQVTKVTEPARATAGSSLDPFLNKATATPVTTLIRNAFGNVVRTDRSPGGGGGPTLTTTEQYDFVGNAIKSIDAKGNEKLRRFDYAGRVIEESQEISVTLSGWLTNTHTLKRRFAYDARGKQVAVLDVYTDGATALQSGQRSVFNAFGDVIEEQRVWGGAATVLDSLSHAKVTTYAYDNAGHLTSKRAGDGETRYLYNLSGDLTRQEQRGDNAAGTVARVTEFGYNARGEAIVQRMPALHAAFEFNGFEGMGVLYVMPFNEQTYDRWGNVISRSQGGYVDIQEETVNTSRRTTTTYLYNHDNKVIAEIAPTVLAWRADGTSYNAIVTHELRYDLLGRAVQERELADDTATGANEATQLRNRSKEYNAAGQLTAETDDTLVRTEYVYDVHGNRVGTKNDLGTVFVDTFDKNGNLESHGVLRLTTAEDSPAYFSGHGTPVVRVLNRYGYDQANRRVESSDVMDAAGTTVHRSFTKLDERNLVRAQRNASGVHTTLEYDQFGSKIREQLGSSVLGNIQTWSYSAADDYSVGRLVSATAGSSTTGYEYNGFGQVKREVYGASNERRYSYHDNGLLKRIDDQFTKGTAGSAGGVDYLSTTEITQYDYTVKGELAQERYTRTGSQDVLEHDAERNRDLIFSHALPAITRTTFIRYDALGRTARVWAPGPANFNNGLTLSSLEYSYDEVGNIRRILAPGTDNWFTYDGEGRMTVADGRLDHGVIGGGTRITYDDVGRRRTTEKFESDQSWLDPETRGTSRETLYTWNEYRVEQYQYDDLSHLEKIYQQLDFRDAYTHVRGVRSIGPHSGATDWYLQEERKTDVRGAVTKRDTWDPVRTISGTLQFEHEPGRKYLTTSSYRADGQLQSQQTLESGNAQFNEVLTEFEYDDGGMLRSYKYVNGVGPRAYVDTFNYTYGLEVGGLKEKTISVSRFAHEDAEPGVQPGNTTNFYDARGRVAKAVVSNAQRAITRTFSYDSQGHALGVDERVWTPNGIEHGSQAHFYANGRQVGTVGTGTLEGSRFSFAYTPITEGLSNPSSYTVRSGDSLMSIAQEVYGDAALWYLIADANSIGLPPDLPLPSTELAKTYRIPSVVRSHNNAGTFKPYNPADIIGNITPSPALPIPPEQCSGVGRVVATAIVIAISMVVQYGVTALTTPYLGPVVGGGLGAAAGDLAGQATGWGLGLQDGIDWGQVGEAGIAGSFAGGAAKAAPGNSLSARLARQGAASVGSQVARGLMGRSSDVDIGGSLFQFGTQLAGAALGSRLDIDNTYFKFGGAASQMFNNAFNPQSGWLFDDRSRDWTNIANQAVGAFTSVAVGAGVDWAQSQMQWSEHEAAVRNARSNRMQTAAGGGGPNMRFGRAPTPDYKGAGSGAGSSTPISQSSWVTGQSAGANLDPDLLALVRAFPERYAIDGQGNFVDMREETIEVSGSKPPQVCEVPKESELDSMQRIIAQMRLNGIVSADVARASKRMMQERGGDLRKIDTSIAWIASGQRWQRMAPNPQADQKDIAELRAQKQQIIDSYDPRQQKTYFVPVTPVNTLQAQLQGPHELTGQLLDPQQNAKYPPNLVPDKPVRVSKYGGVGNYGGGNGFDEGAVRSSINHAYAYDIETDMFQVANDLDRLGRAGYTDIHIATGVHGDPVGGLYGEFSFLKQDARSILSTMQRNSGLTIHPYNMTDPVQRAKFEALQALAAEGNLPGGATLAAHCFSRCRVPDSDPNFTAGPIGSVTVLDRTNLGETYFNAGLQVGFGAMAVYAGTQDSNSTVGTARIIGGSVQIVGGAASAYGYAADSLAMARFGSKLGWAGNLIFAPVAVYDAADDFRSNELARNVLGVEKVGGILFPPLGLMAMEQELGVQAGVDLYERSAAFFGQQTGLPMWGYGF